MRLFVAICLSDEMKNAVTAALHEMKKSGVKGNQGLSAAVKAVRGALDETGIEYDRQKFVPHITIIRKAAGSWKKVKPPKGEMTVKRISLMKSEEKNGKRVYTEVFGVDCR